MTGVDGNHVPNLFRKSVACSSYQVQTCSPEVNHIINPPLTLIDDDCTVVILVMAIISSHLRNIYNSLRARVTAVPGSSLSEVTNFMLLSVTDKNVQ